MTRILLLTLFISLSSHIFGQLTLDACRQKAQVNYPLARQYKLIELTENYNLKNAAKWVTGVSLKTGI